MPIELIIVTTGFRDCEQKAQSGMIWSKNTSLANTLVAIWSRMESRRVESPCVVRALAAINRRCVGPKRICFYAQKLLLWDEVPYKSVKKEHLLCLAASQGDIWLQNRRESKIAPNELVTDLRLEHFGNMLASYYRYRRWSAKKNLPKNVTIARSSLSWIS